MIDTNTILSPSVLELKKLFGELDQEDILLEEESRHSIAAEANKKVKVEEAKNPPLVPEEPVAKKMMAWPSKQRI